MGTKKLEPDAVNNSRAQSCRFQGGMKFPYLVILGSSNVSMKATNPDLIFLLLRAKKKLKILTDQLFLRLLTNHHAL